MHTLEEAFISLGLTKTETATYLAGVAGGALTLQELSKRTRIKQPTLYHALHTLIEKGLASEQKELNKSFFTMADPVTLRSLVERQRDVFDNKMKVLNTVIPMLMKHRLEANRDDISVVQYHGIEGMKNAMDIAMYCKSKHWDIIAPYQNFLRKFDEEYAKKYLRARKAHRITSRSLWEPTLRPGGNLSQDDILTRKPRIMPAHMHGVFKSMMILFDDKVAIFSSYDKRSAIVITSQEIHHMFTAMFEGIWQHAKEYTPTL